MTWYEIRGAHQRAAAFPGTWVAAGKALLRGSYEVARCDSAETAQHLAEIHNLFIPAVNAIIQLRKKLRDRERLDAGTH